MESAEVRQRKPPTANLGDLQQLSTKPPSDPRLKHGIPMQLLRSLLLMTWVDCCIIAICVTQVIGSPLYLINKRYYYSYMAYTKQSFGLVLAALTEWSSPTLFRVSGDASVRGQIHLSKDGLLETRFPERLVLISNHQVYTDWVYLWWVAYTNQMHGRLFIILKESLKYIPLVGTGMMFYGFIFMARKWTSDKPRLEHRLQKLKTVYGGSNSARPQYDPMWLLIFPEGTNLSTNTKRRSDIWGQKQGLPSFKHVILPRSTGLLFCLQQLRGTVDWVYDCTIAYEGPPYVSLSLYSSRTIFTSPSIEREAIPINTSLFAPHICKDDRRPQSTCIGDASTSRRFLLMTRRSLRTGLQHAGPRRINLWISTSKRAGSHPSWPVRSKPIMQ